MRCSSCSLNPKPLNPKPAFVQEPMKDARVKVAQLTMLCVYSGG